VEARNRCADRLVLLGFLGAGRLGWVKLERNRLAPDQLPVADALPADADHAVGDLEVLLLGAEALCRLLEQRGLRGRRRIAQLHAADLDREAPPGRPLSGVGAAIPLLGGVIGR